jgi:hypothetical protein
LVKKLRPPARKNKIFLNKIFLSALARSGFEKVPIGPASLLFIPHDGITGETLREQRMRTRWGANRFRASRTVSRAPPSAFCALPSVFSALPSASVFASPVILPMASFTAPFTCFTEPLSPY